MNDNGRIRLAGAILVLGAGAYAPWLVSHLNLNALWLALPFAAANLLIVGSVLLTLVNNWSRETPSLCPIADGAEPVVAVIVPTCGEPVTMVARTLQSVLNQKWPKRCLRVIVSDDAHSPAIAAMVEALQREHPAAFVLYHEPPRRGEPGRRGEAKAGNLNSALDTIARYWDDVHYIETRDADDEVGDWDFLRLCIGHLEAHVHVAYVQTIKESRVSPGDPFGNQNSLFYRGAMLARQHANAVIPCGSGLVWRKAALFDIGGFPTWNLVEDLQSGVEALRRGWQSAYLPIVGALGQHAPEDIPNVYKQSGTWALDAMRLFFWGDLSGLNLAQRLQFMELGLFYLQGFAAIIIITALAISLGTGIYPLTTGALSYTLHFWPFALGVELFLASLTGRRPYETLLRQREMWIGLAPVFAMACVRALVYGSRRKPTYRVTRKEHQFAWYWRETLPQTLLLVAVFSTLLYRVTSGSILNGFDLGSAYWAVYYGVFLLSFIRKSWFGVGKHAQPTQLAKAEQGLVPVLARDADEVQRRVRTPTTA